MMMDYRMRPRMTNRSKIAQARRAMEMTQDDLAAKLGCSKQMVSRWEVGTRTPKIKTLIRIARALGVSWEDLIEDDELS